MLTIKNPKEAVMAARNYFTHPEQEECIIICLNNNGEVRDIHFMALGSDTAVIMPKKNICKQAVLDMACGIILMHSHPSGNPAPSAADIKQTEEMNKALALFDIQLTDHIVFAGDKYYSFNDEKTYELPCHER